MRRLVALVAVVVAIGALAYYVTAPGPVPAVPVPDHSVDLANGEAMFHIGGCISCHEPGAEDAEESLPSGGAALETPVATFYPPNITPDRETGIGAWSDAEFLTAMQRGVAPDGRHYFPAFPYPHYARMRPADVLDLKGYLMGLEPVRSESQPAQFLLGLPLEPMARRSMVLWKRMAFSPRQIEPDASRSASWNRGAYLVNGPGHCGACHTRRYLLLIPSAGAALSGGPHPEGEGTVPSLRNLVERGRYDDAEDLALALRFGETFGYDDISSGGMASVQMNIAKLPQEDIAAIAEYLVSLE